VKGIHSFLDPVRFKVRVSSFDQVVQVNFFFLNQNDVVLVKKNKSQRVATEFLTGSFRVAESTRQVNRVFPFSIFFSIRPGSSPWSAGFLDDPPGRAGFQNYGNELFNFYFLI
jgi:hypothetical protein